MDTMTRDQFVAFVRDARQGVVATVDPARHPEAALVGVAVTDGGELVFDAPNATSKIANIREKSRVALVIGWDDDVSVQVEGDADILSGPDREAHGRVYLAQFPGSRVLDEGFAVVRVVPGWLRYYDARSEPPVVVEKECW
jgi:pyridoxine/pyridoxamine 5'-phosphate oxidase